MKAIPNLAKATFVVDGIYYTHEEYIKFEADELAACKTNKERLLVLAAQGKLLPGGN